MFISTDSSTKFSLVFLLSSLSLSLSLLAMSGCLDKISCSCECCECEQVKEWLAPKRNAFASTISGALVKLNKINKIEAAIMRQVTLWGTACNLNAIVLI